MRVLQFVFLWLGLCAISGMAAAVISAFPPM